MREAVFEFELLTPAILAGANQQCAEMRIPSIRGALRWWTRLIYGEEEEKRIFGHVTGKICQPSTVSLRLLSSPTPGVKNSQNATSITGNKFDYFLWPLEQKDGQNKRGILLANTRFKVAMKVKNGCDEIDEDILWTFLLFGSLGTRSRRAYGSIWPVSVTIDGEECELPQTEEDFRYYAKSFLADLRITLYRLSKPKKRYEETIETCSSFLKTLRCGKNQYGVAASEWGKNDHDAGLEKEDQIYRAALGLPLVQKYSEKNKRTVEYSIDRWDRFASPLHFKIVKLKDGYMPILLVIPEYAPKDGTVLRAKVKNGRDFMVKLDNDLLNFLIGAYEHDTEKLKNIFPSVKQIAYYAAEE